MSVYVFVGQFVQLDEHGKSYCPCRYDNYPSFQVSQDRSSWYCCADCKGSTVIDFRMNLRAKHSRDGSFSEIIKELRKLVL